MRPVQKNEWPQENGLNKTFHPYQTAKRYLMDIIGDYCSFCEVWGSQSHLEVEHILPKSDPLYAHLEEDWGNFLLACKNCNTIKKVQVVTPTTTYFPHLHNTFLALAFSEGGIVSANPDLDAVQQMKAKNLITLVGLDRTPDHPRYSSRDNRWDLRRIAWDLAQKYLSKYEIGSVTADMIVDLVAQRGFWSIWMTAFHAHTAVKAALIHHFLGTASDSFDGDGNALLRNSPDL